MNRTLPAPARDVALLLARLLLGTVMFAHGYQKLMINGLGRTSQGFESLSIPVAIVSAAFVTVVEVVGGVLVVLGALLTVVACCYLVVMVGAAFFVHIPHGIFVQDGGWELVGVIAALLLALAAAGSGRYGVDDALRRRSARVAATARTEVMAVPAPQDGSPEVLDPDRTGVFPAAEPPVRPLAVPPRRSVWDSPSSLRARPTSPGPTSPGPTSPGPTSPTPTSLGSTSPGPSAARPPAPPSPSGPAAEPLPVRER